MPDAARVADSTAHGTPLAPGPGSLDVMIGYMPAWRALPSGMGAGIEKAADTMKDFMGSASLTPAQTPSKLADVFAAMGQDAGKAAGEGAPGAPAGTAAGATASITANVALTTAYTAAAAVPGGEPAARTAYTEGIKAAAAAAAISAMSAMAGVSDMHICPIPCPIPPHGPGFVTKGSKSVFINGLPAARKGDKVFEACGGSDPIQVGCPTVLIGDDGGGPASGAAAAAQQQAVEDAIEEAQLESQAQSTTQALSQAAQSGAPLVEVCPIWPKVPGSTRDTKHQIAFQVIKDETGEPCPNVRLKIKLPDGTEEMHTTNSNGMIEIDDIDTPGNCEILEMHDDKAYEVVRVEST